MKSSLSSSLLSSFLLLAILKQNTSNLTVSLILIRLIQKIVRKFWIYFESLEKNGRKGKAREEESDGGNKCE